MSTPTGGMLQIVEGSDHPAFRPIALPPVQGLELRLRHHFFYSAHEIPGYLFDIYDGTRFAGTYSALMERDAGKIPETGHIGILLERAFYGQQLPARATRAVLPLFRAHRISELLITFDETNRAIETACAELGARHLDTLHLDGRMNMKRYVLTVPAPHFATRRDPLKTKPHAPIPPALRFLLFVSNRASTVPQGAEANGCR